MITARFLFLARQFKERKREVEREKKKETSNSITICTNVKRERMTNRLRVVLSDMQTFRERHRDKSRRNQIRRNIYMYRMPENEREKKHIVGYNSN